MKSLSLNKTIEKLKTRPMVKGVFTTGTTASKLTPSSDIDLVVILDKNRVDVKSVYTTIENRFADIFFFDLDFLKRLKNKKEFEGNSFAGMFSEWLTKGKIEYDPTKILSELKKEFSKTPPKQKITVLEKNDFWVKVNYNFIANLRYFNSKDVLYHQALEIRLAYSIVEIITAYFSFRNLPWRGEKFTVAYLKQKDPVFFRSFQNYSKSVGLSKKMKFYTELFNKVFSGQYKKWKKDFVILLSNKNRGDQNLSKFWNGLIQ